MKKNLRAVLAAGCAAALVGSFALFGCSSNEAADEPAPEATEQTADQASEPTEAVQLQVFAANSLSKAMEEAQALYTEQNPGVTFADTQYKASGELNEMLAAGSYADLEITASKGTMDTAVEEKYVDEGTRVDMFTNDLVIVSKEGSGLKDVTLQDIADGKYTVCVGDDSVPAGNYAAQALSTVGAYESPDGKTSKDISGKEGQYVGITPLLQTSVGNVCKAAESGEVQLAIVYSSDVYRFGGVEVVGEIPADTHKNIVYPGAVTAQSENAEAAQAFLDWCLTDPDVQKIWAEWGFTMAA